MDDNKFNKNFQWIFCFKKYNKITKQFLIFLLLKQPLPRVLATLKEKNKYKHTKTLLKLKRNRRKTRFFFRLDAPGTTKSSDNSFLMLRARNSLSSNETYLTKETKTFFFNLENIIYNIFKTNIEKEIFALLSVIKLSIWPIASVIWNANTRSTRNLLIINLFNVLLFFLKKRVEHKNIKT